MTPFRLTLAKALPAGEHWITIHPHGTGVNAAGEDMTGRHVLIDGDGRIIGGSVPRSAHGQHITNWWKTDQGHAEPALSRHLREHGREHTLTPRTFLLPNQYSTPRASHEIRMGHGHQTQEVRNLTTRRGTHEETLPGHLAVRARSGDRYWLDSAFADKDALKEAGARWDGDNRSWYAPNRAVLHRILADAAHFPHVTIDARAVDAYETPEAPETRRTPGPDLPALSGTPKQVAWAEEIREKILQRDGAEIERLMQAPGRPDLTPAQREQVAAIHEAVRAWWDAIQQQPTARWWIDHRDAAWMIEASQVAREAAHSVRKGYFTTGYGEGRAPAKTPDAGKRRHPTARIDAATHEESLPTIRLHGFTPNVAWALLRRAGYRLRITEGQAMLPGQTTIRVSADGAITLVGAQAARYAAWFNRQLRDMVDWAGQIDGKQDVSSIRAHGGHFS